LFHLIRTLVRPYRGTLFVILMAMLVETAMSVAGPWPLKIILDNVVGSHKLSPWLDNLLKPILSGGSKMQIADVPSPATTLADLLRQPSNRHDSEYHHVRRADDPGLRIVIYTRHCR